jgi:hypothetical protein
MPWFIRQRDSEVVAPVVGEQTSYLIKSPFRIGTIGEGANCLATFSLQRNSKHETEHQSPSEIPGWSPGW